MPLAVEPSAGESVQQGPEFRGRKVAVGVLVGGGEEGLGGFVDQARADVAG
ncbi:hypothetical protein OG874_22965 [Nocardia sp. NBC_00565]|uniref:hypothetical protein n=1 Tax=Nocardia sp. NBC_00565 TaxID=2975993 RepID=UPI002E817B25|nr:hypothetical protein [Nocardia sp. NBC_00565]WUB99796.1 hypothetical protein OG874_22965 [Nocardia sp. NBC_00565]